MTEKMFETAARTKMRFPFRGQISTEDLFDLSVEDLDTIFKSLNSQLKQVNEESLLQAKTDHDKELDTKIEIIKHIVATKITESNARIQAKERKEKKDKILEILASKQEESLQNKSQEELIEMLNALDG